MFTEHRNTCLMSIFYNLHLKTLTHRSITKKIIFLHICRDTKSMGCCWLPINDTKHWFERSQPYYSMILEPHKVSPSALTQCCLFYKAYSVCHGSTLICTHYDTEESEQKIHSNAGTCGRIYVFSIIHEISADHSTLGKRHVVLIYGISRSVLQW